MREYCKCRICRLLTDKKNSVMVHDSHHVMGFITTEIYCSSCWDEARAKKDAKGRKHDG